MDLPLIVDNFGDTMIFSTEAEVADSLEAQDVLANKYVAYDSHGRLLTLGVNSRGAVIVSGGEENPTHADTLRQLLLKYLTFYQGSQARLDEMPLEELMTKSVEEAYRPRPEATWVDNLPPILTWLLILAMSVGAGYAVHHNKPRWPAGISWLIGVLVFFAGLVLAEFLNLVIKSLFGLFTKKVE